MDNVLDGQVGGAPVRETPQIEFAGRRGALFFLVFKNVLLNIFTLGIFRFWGKTRVRRYFWGNIVIGGEPLEYVGRGMEMFIGFLIVLAVLVPLSLAGSGIRYLFQGDEIWARFIFDLLYFPIFLFLVQFALFRMWRYRLTRTVWRGLRFGLDGDALPYAFRAFGWWIARILTLGLVHPWANVYLMGYKMRRVRFGNTKFNFTGNGKALIVPWLIAWIIPGSLLIFGSISTQVYAFQMMQNISQGLQTLPKPSAWSIAGFSVLPIGTIIFLLTFTWYRVREFRYFAKCIGFGEARLASEARTRKILPWLLLAGVAFFGLIGIIFSVFVAVGASVGTAATGIEAFIPIILPILVLLFMPVITYPIVVFSIVRHLWMTLSITNPQAFEAALKAVDEAPQFGEGLADAFDVGAI